MRALLVFLTLIAPLGAQTPESLDFLAGLPDFREVRSMLPSAMNRAALALLEQREREVARLATLEDVARRRAYLRERTLRAIGGLPLRTPLQARSVATLDREGYRIEKVIFESQPKFYVVANLYLPKTGRSPYPAVLFPLGHEAGAKAHAAWQYMLVTLARRGYVALAWDPVGQGERVQMFDPDWGESKVIRSTTEHTMQGIQCLLAGDSLARYTIHDGIRALDYLLSRPEVDPQRVACTGNSGGGTHTAYLAALDDRIQVAAPSCYLTSWRRLLESIGPQDAEQCLPPWLGDGLDHPDFILAFAPKPYLVLSAVRDFFSISGARETYAQARAVYERLGAGEKISMTEADDGHGYSKPRREAAYRWFGKWLKGAEDAEPEAPVQPETEATLWATETGQVATSLAGETVHSLNWKRVEQARAGRATIAETPKRVQELMAWRPVSGPLKVHPFGRMERQGYRIEKLLYESEPGILVPALLYAPAGGPARKAAVLYVDSRGKSAGAAELEQIARAGLVALSIDMRGAGETRTSSPDAGSDFPRYFGDYHSAMKALLIGRPLVGQRALDITRGLDWLATRPEVDPQRIYGFGRESGAVALLHAAAVDPRLRRLALEGMLASYESVVKGHLHRNVFESVVPGALRSYDLPQLAAALAPRPVSVVNAASPLGQRVSLAEARRLYPQAAERQPGEEFRTTYAELIR